MGWAYKYEQTMLELPELAIVKDITTLGLMTPGLEILFQEPLRSRAVGEILVMEGQGCCQRRGGGQVLAACGRAQLEGSWAKEGSSEKQDLSFSVALSLSVSVS